MIEIPKDIFSDVPSKCKECNHNTTKWLADHDKRIRDEVIEDIIQEMEILNHQGGGLDDLLFYLNNMKGEQNE
jgi:hypothetical protein